MKRRLVLAGNFAEAQRYARGTHPRDFIITYASGIEAIAGSEYDELEVVGTFWSRPNAGEIYDLAKTRVRLPPPIKQYERTIGKL